MNDLQMMAVPPYIGVKDVKTYFTYGRKKTLSLLAQRKIKGKRDGKAWVISTASIIRHLNRYTNLPKGEINV